MTKGKTYRYDDEFKAKARAHQFAFRENELNDFYDEKNPQVILSPDASKQGLIFCDTYRDLIKSKVISFKSSIDNVESFLLYCSPICCEANTYLITYLLQWKRTWMLLLCCLTK